MADHASSDYCFGPAYSCDVICKMLRSKFSIPQAILIPLLLCTMTFGLSALLLTAGFLGVSKSDYKAFLLVGFGLVFLTMGGLSIRHFSNILNTITLDIDGFVITGIFRKRMVKWSQVSNMNLIGKEMESFMFSSMPMEAFSITLGSDERLIFFTKLYSNQAQVRKVLDSVLRKIKYHETITSDCFKVLPTQKTKLRNESLLTQYGGNHLLTLNGIMAHGGILFIAWFWIFSGSPMGFIPKLIFSFFILTFCQGLYGYQLHYFKMDSEFLVVKNHVWLWKKDVYRISELREIVFEEPHKMSTSLRPITLNYESKLYPAGSIRSKSWKRLRREFIKHKVPTRDEAYFDY